MSLEHKSVPGGAFIKIILETPRLALRELVDEDIDFIADLLGDAEVMRFFPRPSSREEAAGWIARQRERYERDGVGYWLAIERRSARPVGQAGLLMTEIEGREEPALGYIIHQRFWRRGCATELARACVEYAFRTFKNTPRVITLIRPANEPSLGVARKLEMQAGEQVEYEGIDHTLYYLPNPEAGG